MVLSRVLGHSCDSCGSQDRAPGPKLNSPSVVANLSGHKALTVSEGLGRQGLGPPVLLPMREADALHTRVLSVDHTEPQFPQVAPRAILGVARNLTN